MKAKLLTAMLLGAVVSTSAAAQSYVCPAPSQINCVPAVMNVAGWQHNGSQSTGNSFTPNSQCANVIPLGPGTQRLLCCYSKCGVFIRDVSARMCTKVSERAFSCR